MTAALVAAGCGAPRPDRSLFGPGWPAAPSCSPGCRRSWPSAPPARGPPTRSSLQVGLW